MTMPEGGVAKEEQKARNDREHGILRKIPMLLRRCGEEMLHFVHDLQHHLFGKKGVTEKNCRLWFLHGGCIRMAICYQMWVKRHSHQKELPWF